MLKQLNTKLSLNKEFQDMCNKQRKTLGRTEKSIYFYTPPLFVDNCIHAFNLSKSASVFDHEVLYDQHTYQLSHAFVTRFANSYTDNKLHGECKTDINKCMFAKEAIKYAKRFWKLHVLPPFYTDTVMFADPKKQRDRVLGGAPIQYSVYAIKEPNSHYSPSFYLKTIGATLDNHIIDEIRYHSGSYSYCVHCGGMLGKDKCVNCNIQFKEESFLCYGDGSLVDGNVAQFVIERESDIKDKYGIVQEEPILTMITEEEHQEIIRKIEELREIKRLEEEAKRLWYEQQHKKYITLFETSWLDELDKIDDTDYVSYLNELNSEPIIESKIKNGKDVTKLLLEAID
jgi:hypothetical protein